MPSRVTERVQKHRKALRLAGLRFVQIWVPDTRKPNFAAECHRQSLLASQADSVDTDLSEFIDQALSDTESWTA